MQSLFEIRLIFHRLVADVVVLDLAPDLLAWIELRRMAGEKKNPQLAPVGADKFAHLLGTMKRSAVGDQDQRALAPLDQLLQEANIALGVHLLFAQVVAHIAAFTWVRYDIHNA